MWNETKYEPGEVKVVSYDTAGNKAAEKVMGTAGKPHHFVLTSNHDFIHADSEDFAYITIQVADKDGNIVPADSRIVKFSVSGAGTFEATANGDPTSLMPFQNPEIKLFSEAATAIVRSADKSGMLKFIASSKGLRPATITIQVQ